MLVNQVHEPSFMCAVPEVYIVMALATMFYVEVILQVRLFALYNFRKQVTIPVATFFSILVCSQLGMTSYLIYYDNLYFTGPDTTLSSIFWICTGGKRKLYNI
ncbi:hypothetical protein SERLA73DRAFT_165872, partial [Serpula lacrymans var. lacrymans S7.3]